MDDNTIHLCGLADRLMKQFETLRKESAHLMKEAQRLREIAKELGIGQTGKDDLKQDRRYQSLCHSILA